MERQCGGLLVSVEGFFYIRGEGPQRGSSGKGSSSMKLNKKATALLLGLTLGISGTAFAADGADSFSDVPQGHWAYDALDYLAKDGVIDGMGDGTFQGNRTMTRYEMASIVAKAMQKGNLGVGDQAVLEKLEKEYGSELATLSKQVNANTKAIKDLNAKTDKFKVWGMTRVQMGKDTGLAKYVSYEGDQVSKYNNGRNGDYNNRFYMDLEGQMKINDHAVARFTVEKNARYRDSEARRLVRIGSNGKDANGYSMYVLPAASHAGNDTADYDSTHNGSVSNIWVELQLGPKHDWYTNIGRKWNGIGMQNLLLGGVVDGIATYHPIEGGHGWWFSGQYYQGASNWHEEGKIDDDDLNAALKKEKVERFDQLSGDAQAKLLNFSYKGTAGRQPVFGAVNFWGPIGKYVDASLAYLRVVQHQNDYYCKAKNFWGIDLKVKPFKDFSLTGSFTKNDAKASTMGQSQVQAGWNRDIAVRADYRHTDLNKVGSWNLWAKWQMMGSMGDPGHDDEWATREPTYTNGAKGWLVGFNLVPWKNVEWGTLYGRVRENYSIPDSWTTWDGYPGKDYHRTILRTWLDFHF